MYPFNKLSKEQFELVWHLSMCAGSIALIMLGHSLLDTRAGLGLTFMLYGLGLGLLGYFGGDDLS